MQQVAALISRVGPTEARVLITGESGTGKELVAAAIHAASRRAGRAFVTVNCAAIPRDLVESEMFGHERGSFTGATERRLGRFELAHGGTLFLDEVGDLSQEAQAKLLRTLETGELQRIGAETMMRIDARVIAATNRQLEEAVSNGGVPGRPLLPAQRLSDPPATTARASGGSARPGGPLGRASPATPCGAVHRCSARCPRLVFLARQRPGAGQSGRAAEHSQRSGGGRHRGPPGHPRRSCRPRDDTLDGAARVGR